MDQKLSTLMRTLEKNNIEAFYAEDKKEALHKVECLLPEGGTVTHGGSVTLSQCGIIELLKQGKYNYLDRNVPGLSREQVEEIYRKTFGADVYITSANAVTMDGVLYNVDGNSNRVASILYGPKEVIFVVGRNKIVDTLDQAVERVRSVAAPKNAKRLNCDTYCKTQGRCIAKPGAPMGAGCSSRDRVCCNYVVSAQQRVKGRIKVILVNEDLGY